MRAAWLTSILLPGLLAGGLLLSGPAPAQVYKCKGKSGETVYSQDPCASDAKPVVLRSGQTAGMNRRLDRQCLNQASARIYAASNDRISMLQQQIQTLASQANNTPRIGELRQAINREHANANRQLEAARQQCMVDVPIETPPPPTEETAPADTGAAY